jgi:sugar phosphate isomerase/epimerase
VSQAPPILGSTGPFYMFSLEETFELLAEAGFDGVELMITQDRVSQDPLRMAAVARRYGMPVPAIHGPFLLATWFVYGTDPKGKLERCVEYAETARVPTVVIHPPYRWQVSYAAWLVERIERVREETGVTIAVENMFPVWLNGRRPPMQASGRDAVHGRPAEPPPMQASGGRLAEPPPAQASEEMPPMGGRWSRLQFHNGIEPQEIGQYPYVALDLSHAAVAGVDILDAYATLGEQVVHTHVSNNAGKGRDTHAALDQGILPVPEFLEELSANGFGGAVTLELDVRPWADSRPALIEFLRENVAIARQHLNAGAKRVRQGRIAP